MKKLLKIVLCLILVFSLMPKEEAKAEEGVITNIVIDGDTISWDPYPGTAEYWLHVVDVNHYYLTESTTFDLKLLMAVSSVETGDYRIEIQAEDADHNLIAAGTSDAYYHHESLGKLDIPQNPVWKGTKAGWDPVTNANRYRVDIYKNGEWMDAIWTYETNELELRNYIQGSENAYQFTVVAQGDNYLNSETSELSPAIYGVDVVLERIAGSSRYETSLNIADKVKEVLGIDKFDSVVIATGTNYPDALSGSFLANTYGAPMLMINEKNAQKVTDYVKNNVAAGGNVYILGGTGVVKDEWLSDLQGSYEVKRLSGKGRYDTNLAILHEAGVEAGLLLVCTGNGFADSLSCSALDLPILLVGKSLTNAQKEYLAANSGSFAFFLIGGEGAVSGAVADELSQYGQILGRISGKNRYVTSVSIADFFTDNNGATVITTGKNYPDGLSGGPLAYALGAPLILVDDGKTADAEVYTTQNPVNAGYALGGTGALSEAVFNAVFHVMTESYQ